MADILIRGMEMPKEGEKILIATDGSVWVNAWPTRGYMRMENVYAIPLPEGHGDLVERKALNLFPDYKDVRNRIKQTIKATERDGRNITGVTIDLLKQTLVALDSLHSVRRYFLNAKTIVPAEGGTDE